MLKTKTVFTREQSAQFELSFELRKFNYHANDGILDRVYANLHHNVYFELRNMNDHLNDGILDRVYAKLHRDV